MLCFDVMNVVLMVLCCASAGLVLWRVIVIVVLCFDVIVRC